MVVCIRALSWVLLSVVLCAPAQAADAQEAAKRAFDDGQQAFVGEHYEQAYAAFSRAYDLAQLPELLFNMARCLEALDRLDKAIVLYERFVALRPGTEADGRLAALRLRLARRMVAAPSLGGSRSAPTSGPGSSALVIVVPAASRPLHQRWWLWTAVGGTVVLGLGLGLGLGLSRGDGVSSLPIVSAR